MSKESTGTRALFEMAMPLLSALEGGSTFVVDELNTGLHPLAFQHIVRLFCSAKTNPNNAQLIFTTHDTSVTERSCIGSDQIWMVEKGDDLMARLTPYSDFKPREKSGRSFQRSYLQGRLGGVPALSDFARG